MHITQLQVKNFRCFEHKALNFDAPITLVQGNNGSGKTSLLEALYYLGYLRSFRASNTRDLIKLGCQEFFVKASLRTDQLDTHDLQIGFSSKKRLVKLDQKTVTSFKDLMDVYRIITLAEDDLALIKEGPDYRRSFIDHALVLLYPDLLVVFKEFKHILEQRNALLHNQYSSQDKTAYYVWTEQLWQVSQVIALKRQELLVAFEQQVNELSKTYLPFGLLIRLEYRPKLRVLEQPFELFMNHIDTLYNQEIRFKRSLFGSHLDDYVIIFDDKQSRLYASRGQQKLTIILLKVAFLKMLSTSRGKAVFLLDDFMTDFDEEKAALLIPLLTQLSNQLIFTSPVRESIFDRLLAEHNILKYNLL